MICVTDHSTRHGRFKPPSFESLWDSSVVYRGDFSETDLRARFLVGRQWDGYARGRSVGLVDSGRWPATRLPAVLRARAPTRTPATALGPVLGEGSCLSESCSPRCVELLFEAVAAALPPVPVALDSGQLLAQAFDLSFLFPNAGIAGILLGRRTLRSHHAVMPHP